MSWLPVKTSFSVYSQGHVQLWVFLLCVYLYKDSYSTCGIAETISGSFWYVDAKGLVASHHEQIEVLAFYCYFWRYHDQNLGYSPWKSTFFFFFFWQPHSSAPWSIPAISDYMSQLWTIPTETQESCSFPVTRGSYLLFQVAIHILLVISLHFYFFFSLYRLLGLFYHREDF